MKYDNRRRYRPELPVIYILEAFDKKTELLAKSYMLQKIELSFLRELMEINMDHHNPLYLDLMACFDLTRNQIHSLMAYIDVKHHQEIDFELYDYQLQGEES